MSGLMNNYFYGKAGQGDYTVDQMPTTRVQLFFTTLKVRFSSLIALNLLHVVFLLPFLVWTFIGYQTLTIYTSDEAYKLGGEEMKAAYMEYTQLQTEYNAIVNEPENTKQLEYDLEDVNQRIEKLNRGEAVMVVEPAVVEGAEPTEREVTMEELTAEKKAVEEKLAMQETYREKAADESGVADLRARLNDAAVLYNQYQRSGVTSNLSLTLLIMIPLIGLAGIGSTGQMYVLRNWARDEHAFMWQDYKAAIKANWKQGLAVGLMNGASIFLTYIAYLTYGDMAANTSQFFVIPQMLMVVLLIVWWMMNEIIFPMMVTYEMNIRQLLRNSAIMVVAKLPLSFVILLGSLLVPLLILFLVPYLAISVLALIVIYGLFGFSLTGFVYASYANSLFDKYLNPRIEGAEVNKGLRQPDDDDDEEETENAPEVQPKEDRFWEHKSE